MRPLVITVALTVMLATPIEAGELTGPGRFCGYSPIIDLLAGEKVTTLESGIHSGSFRWEGAFGSFEVYGLGWAAKPKGRIADPGTASTPTRFAQRRVKGGYQITIWNRSHGLASFTSARPFTTQQIETIGRVHLLDEGQKAAGCNWRTITVWEQVPGDSKSSMPATSVNAPLAHPWR